MQSVQQERLVASDIYVTSECAVGRAADELSHQHTQIKDTSLLPPNRNECALTVGDRGFAARIHKSNAGSSVITLQVADVDAVNVDIAHYGTSTKIDRLVGNEDG